MKILLKFNILVFALVITIVSCNKGPTRATYHKSTEQTPTATNTNTLTSTISITSTPTITSTVSSTCTPTYTRTITSSFTRTPTMTVVYSSTPTFTITNTPTLQIGYITTVAGNGNPGYIGDDGMALLACLQVIDVAADSFGNIFLADYSNGRIRKINSNGIITTYAGGGSNGSGNGILATSANINTPNSVEVDGAGNVFISCNLSGLIRKVDTMGIINTVAGGGSNTNNGVSATTALLSYPTGAASDSFGNIYLCEDNHCLVRKVNTGGIISTIAGTGIQSHDGDGGFAINASVSFPIHLSIDANNNIYVVEGSSCSIRKVDSSGYISTIAGSTSCTGGLGDNGPATLAFVAADDVVVDTLGNIYVADGFHNRVRMVNTSGLITTIAGTGTEGYSGDGGLAVLADLNYPTGLAISAGYLYIADSNNNRIRKMRLY